MSAAEFAGEGWGLLDDALQATLARSPAARSRYDRVSARLPDGMRSQIQRAARQRGIGVEAYIRRAVAALVVHDLDLDWWELLAEEPWTQGYGTGLNESRPRAGSGFGDWHIDSLSPAP